MTYKFFIDDERYPPLDHDFWSIARTSEEAKIIVETFGVPTFISFDHDLGEKDTSFIFLKWFVGYLLDNNLKFPEYYVHSQNPVGKANIEGFIESFKKFQGETNEQD